MIRNTILSWSLQTRQKVYEYLPYSRPIILELEYGVQQKATQYRRISGQTWSVAPLYKELILSSVKICWTKSTPFSAQQPTSTRDRSTWSLAILRLQFKVDQLAVVFIIRLYLPRPRYGDGVLFSIDLFVCLFIYLFVYLFASSSARLRENGWTDMHEIFRESVEWPLTMPWDDLITFWVNSEKPCNANFFVSNITSKRLNQFAWHFQGIKVWSIDDKNIDFRIKNIKNMFFSLL